MHPPFALRRQLRTPLCFALSSLYPPYALHPLLCIPPLLCGLCSAGVHKILKLKSLNASLLAIVAVDTAENELSKVSKNYGVESGSCRGYLKAAGLVALLDAAEIAGVDAALILEAQTRVA